MTRSSWSSSAICGSPASMRRACTRCTWTSRCGPRPDAGHCPRQSRVPRQARGPRRGLHRHCPKPEERALAILQHDQEQTGINEDEAVAVLLEKYEIVRAMFPAWTYSAGYVSRLDAKPQQRLVRHGAERSIGC